MATAEAGLMQGMLEARGVTQEPRGATSPVRLAMVVPSMRGGGLERIVSDLARELDPARYRVAVFCVNGLGVYADELAAAGIEVHDCTEPALRVRGLPLRLIRALRRFRPALIHAHSGTWYPSAVARSVLRRPRLIFTDHGRYLPEPSGRAWIERWCARRTDAVVAVSTELADYITSFLRLATPPEVVPNGVAVDRLRVSDRNVRIAQRAEWRLEGEDVAGIVVGRFVPVKNHLGMLEAFSRALQRAPRLRLVLLGQGPLEGEIRTRAAALGVEDRVRMVGFRRDVAECMAASDFFLMPSDSEGLPMSLLEAMGAGLPVVASDVGGIPGALGDPPCGLLVPPRSVEALATALGTMAESASLRATFASRARARASAFGLDVCARRHTAIYDSVLERARARRRG